MWDPEDDSNWPGVEKWFHGCQVLSSSAKVRLTVWAQYIAMRTCRDHFSLVHSISRKEQFTITASKHSASNSRYKFSRNPFPPSSQFLGVPCRDSQTDRTGSSFTEGNPGDQGCCSCGQQMSRVRLPGISCLSQAFISLCSAILSWKSSSPQFPSSGQLIQGSPCAKAKRIYLYLWIMQIISLWITECSCYFGEQ